jgi:hypothetical protein
MPIPQLHAICGGLRCLRLVDSCQSALGWQSRESGRSFRLQGRGRECLPVGGLQPVHFRTACSGKRPSIQAAGQGAKGRFLVELAVEADEVGAGCIASPCLLSASSAVWRQAETRGVFDLRRCNVCPKLNGAKMNSAGLVHPGAFHSVPVPYKWTMNP